MATEPEVEAVLESEPPPAAEITTLSIELDAIPGAVWQTELHALMPPDIRVSLFERGTQKCALLTFPPGERQRASDAFDVALKAANEVSEQAHAAALQARVARGSVPAPGSVDRPSPTALRLGDRA